MEIFKSIYLQVKLDIPCLGFKADLGEAEMYATSDGCF